MPIRRAWKSGPGLFRLSGNDAGGVGIPGNKARSQSELIMVGSLRDLIPDGDVLARVDRVLELPWPRGEVWHVYAADSADRPPGIDPEAALRSMLAGPLLGVVHDRRPMREAHDHRRVHERLTISPQPTSTSAAGRPSCSGASASGGTRSGAAACGTRAEPPNFASLVSQSPC